ncbi:unnamed protein product [Cuscuta europaea]|uniref:Uncharacterized protein n=1 Tax=Cuscuta europaea TaxID=41803 RepID=A0A9P0YX53_CUSEU|nr:unnamed protein product [Cuscuta europaea]
MRVVSLAQFEGV